ncbi:hypothetical protein DID88_004613 [Monilinia fructigena]|uniref:phospholipase D n=1 Tax=Monilinia fructigena TaxID=38457 RepID=A0A395IRK7_9HELO|nr:hypothetical protein DID88_004613 [Monilinia fructigena]
MSHFLHKAESAIGGFKDLAVFAPPRTGHDIKWHVDGCEYMWAVSVALEEAQESIWILDWWLTPELYLRRPPSANEESTSLFYKEVTKVLTLCSEHTKKALEVHPNISVFRHPDHAPSGIHVESEIITDLKNFSLKDLDLAKLPEEGIKALYGARNDVILYWAHHEKLCLVDSKVAFMGGLDLCFGRWDVNQHPIADAHPSDLDNILFPGQDFNNARVYDFQRRFKLANIISLIVPSTLEWDVEDLRAHFVQRWNFIFREKYNYKDSRYSPLSLTTTEIPDGYYNEDGSNVGETAGGAISDTFRRAVFHHCLFQRTAPVDNKIGAAIAERIIRAYQNGEQYKVIVCIPAVPAFAGDLHADDALGTRAIMEYQYNSICRGGSHIMETVANAGVPDPKEYIRFYNLRNYDRLNNNSTMSRAEQDSGVSYERARKEHDDIVGADGWLR